MTSLCVLSSFQVQNIRSIRKDSSKIFSSFFFNARFSQFIGSYIVPHTFKGIPQPSGSALIVIRVVWIQLSAIWGVWNFRGVWISLLSELHHRIPLMVSSIMTSCSSLDSSIMMSPESSVQVLTVDLALVQDLWRGLNILTHRSGGKSFTWLIGG